MMQFMGISGAKIIEAHKDDRAHHSDKGICFYWRSANWGLKLPISPFVFEIIHKLNVAPSQLTSVALCHINSFEEYFYQEMPRYQETQGPSLNLFLRFFRFQFPSRSPSWITIRRTQDCPFGTINKVTHWQNSFFYMPICDENVSYLDKLRRDWNLDPINFPELGSLSEDEEKILKLINEHYSGPHFIHPQNYLDLYFHE